MRTIYRYPIDMEECAQGGGFFDLYLPLGTEILHVAVQERAPHQPCMWALVNPEREEAPRRRFLLAGTGHTYEHELSHGIQQYLGTFQQHGFVWHVWEIPV
jgi:hypothetical protein